MGNGCIDLWKVPYKSKDFDNQSPSSWTYHNVPEFAERFVEFVLVDGTVKVPHEERPRGSRMKLVKLFLEVLDLTVIHADICNANKCEEKQWNNLVHEYMSSITLDYEE